MSTLYLDLFIEINHESRLRTKPYDNKDDFNFFIVKFTFICSIIPAQLHMECIFQSLSFLNEEDIEPRVPSG
jgi:hypothetical protein